jgi:hypothetical protein
MSSWLNLISRWEKIQIFRPGNRFVTAERFQTSYDMVGSETLQRELELESPFNVNLLNSGVYHPTSFTEYDIPSAGTAISKPTFDLGQKTFDFKYVKVKFALKLEAVGKTKRAGVEFALGGFTGAASVVYIQSVFAAEIFKNLTVEDSIEPGKAGKLSVKTKGFKIEVNYDATLNWATLFKAEIRSKINTLTASIWSIEGGCNLVATFTFGPNLLNIAKYWKPLIARGWTFSRIVNQKSIWAKLLDEGGKELAFSLAVELLEHILEVPLKPLEVFKMMYNFAKDQAYGKMLAAAKRYADGYYTSLSYYTISDQYSLTAFDYYHWEPPRKGMSSRDTLFYLSGSKELILRNLDVVLKRTISQEQGTDKWDLTMNTAHLLGGAHGLFTWKQFHGQINSLYGQEQATIIWQRIRRVNSGLKGLPGEYGNFIYNQFKDDPERTNIQEFPLDLYEVIKSGPIPKLIK